MPSSPGALARWRSHLEEVVGVEDAAAILDPFYTVSWSDLATTADLERLDRRIDGLDARIDRIEDQLIGLRRDLLKVTGAQFLALVGAVAAVLGWG